MSAVFVCDYIRTPIGRYGGMLAGIRPDDLAAHVLKSLVTRNPSLAATVDEVILGCANQAGEDNRNVARMAVLLAGLPETVPALTVNRLCASGMDAVIAGYRTILAGEADVIIVGGVESMSRAPFVMPKAQTSFDRNAQIYDTTIGWRFVNKVFEAAYGTDSMPETAENVVEEHRISREDQDAFALSSQTRAALAIRSGRFAKEIAPVPVPTRKEPDAVASTDEHPRATTLEKLSKLPAPFRSGGTVTAGNASGVNDGATALVLCSERGLSLLGVQPMARISGAASAGVAPRVMGIGPVPVIEKLTARMGVRPTDFDLIELNEAFAAQAIAVCRALDLDPMADDINPNGGAIALGHPLGMTGARLVGTAAQEMQLTSKSRALCSLCVGVGQGVAIALETP
jgi:3-oxoadipyl-CoA thiolase